MPFIETNSSLPDHLEILIFWEVKLCQIFLKF